MRAQAGDMYRTDETWRSPLPNRPRIEGNGEFISHLRGQDRGSLHGVSLFCAIDASAALRGISQD